MSMSEISRSGARQRVGAELGDPPAGRGRSRTAPRPPGRGRCASAVPPALLADQRAVSPALASTAAIHSAHSWSCGLKSIDDLGAGRRRRPGEHPPGAQPQPLLPGRELGDGVVGDPGRDPLVGRQQRVGRARPVAEGGERLLVRVRRPVRHLDLGPVLRRCSSDMSAGSPANSCSAKSRPATTLSSREWSIRIGTGSISMSRVRIRLDLPGHLGRALDALGAQREAVDHHVGQVERADVRDIGQARPAVDQDVIVAVSSDTARSASRNSPPYSSS